MMLMFIHTLAASLPAIHKSHILLLPVTVADKTPFGIQAEVTLKTNFFATRDMCNEFLPIIKPGGKSHPPPCFNTQSSICITSDDQDAVLKSFNATS